MLDKLIKRMKEDKVLIFIFIVWVIAFASAFYKDNIFSNIIRAGSLFLFFIFPPYLFYLSKKMDDRKVLFVYCCLYTGIVLLVSYYLGIIGLNIKYHIFIIPLVAIIYSLIKISRDKSWREKQ